MDACAQVPEQVTSDLAPAWILRSMLGGGSVDNATNRWVSWGDAKRRIDKLAGQDNLRSLIKRVPPIVANPGGGTDGSYDISYCGKFGEGHLAGKAWYWR